MAFIPQNPGSALNPVLTIGWQLREALKAHQALSRSAARDRIVEVLDLAGIPEPRYQLDRYPHEFSGGMKQRILIAMGLLNHPALLIADEPTTALDTTMQAKVLELMSDLVDSFEMALLLITHNMGVVASVCDRVAVMYAGQIVEAGPAADLFRAPLHPYTDLLLRSTPTFGSPPVGRQCPRGQTTKPYRPAEWLFISGALPPRRGEVQGDATQSRGVKGTLRPVLGGSENRVGWSHKQLVCPTTPSIDELTRATTSKVRGHGRNSLKKPHQGLPPTAPLSLAVRDVKKHFEGRRGLGRRAGTPSSLSME